MIAGVVLGSLAMRTRSIYAGFLVHATVAVLMDVLALYHRRGSLPMLLAPGSSTHLTFSSTGALSSGSRGALALAVLAVEAPALVAGATAAVQAGAPARASNG